MNSAPAYHGSPESAWQERQQDTGWGRAFAHLIPGYGIFYAIRRRTFTPLLLNIVGGFSLGIFVGLVGANATQTQRETTAMWLGLAATPLLAKQGIDMARKDGELRLKGIKTSPFTGLTQVQKPKVTGTIPSVVRVTQNLST